MILAVHHEKPCTDTNLLDPQCNANRVKIIAVCMPLYGSILMHVDTRSKICISSVIIS